MERRGIRQRGWLEGEPTYQEWMQTEGIPLYEAFASIEDVTELPRRPWARMGGKGCFIELEGTVQGRELLYMVEIPPGEALEPERHLYDELIYIWRGRGLAEVWHVGQTKRSFEWGDGSLFAIPTNAWHRLVNGGREPVLVFARTNAPIVIETLRNTDFIFNCDYNFTDRYAGQVDYFLAGEKRYKGEEKIRTYWETNFVPDVRSAFLDDMFEKVEGGQITFFSMASWAGGHVSAWPMGRYHKAHYGGPGGAVLLGLKSMGYALIWPKWCGVHPYQDGHGDKVIKMNWKPGSIYCSGAGAKEGGEWFHCHYNTGPEPARQINFGGAALSFIRPENLPGGPAGHVSVRDGGRLIEYEDEDPEIRRMFEEALRQKSLECTMKPVVYRTDPFTFSLL